ncbi:hypothetical protein PybrP1_007345 [[Pythium] brassicae (nom. inval.)]|nr:hypothetical protein PybrP1_007345 [[Pythium] brassicae (nom. inval.)]
MAATKRASQPKNPYQAFLQQTDALPAASASQDTAVDATMGVPMDTRNYQELLRQAGGAQPPVAVTVRGNKAEQRASPPAPRFAVLLGGSTNNEPPILSGRPVPAQDDHTVRGLPVDTRNYEAFARHGGAPPPAYSASVAPPPPPSFPLGRTASLEEEASGDTVYGLPINTGNYEALVGAGAKVKKSRPRTFSDQQDPARDGRRVSAPALHAPPQYKTMPSPAPATMNDVARGSCFETRRAATVAIVPYSGWLYIQSSTLKQWKKHYAVLSGVDFKYSKGLGQAPKGFGTVQSFQPWNGKPHGLSLKLASGKLLLAHCQNAGELEGWTSALQKSLDKLQHLSENSKTSYTMTASEQLDGFLYVQDARAATWRRQYFVARIDGYLECRATEDASSADSRLSGYVKAVSFADVHPNGLAVQLASGVSVLAYAETYDERMLWYAAMSSGALANDRTPHAGAASSVKSTYVQTARANHAGWMCMQAGLFKSWKRFYFTLHGAEVSFAKDTNSPVVLCDKIRSAEDWPGKPNGLEIRLKSGRVWRVYADSYDSAKRWRTLMQGAVRQNNGEFNMKRYLASRKRKGLSPVFGGWLTSVKDSGVKLRQFYVVDGNILGDASEVDHQLQPIGRIESVTASRDLSCGLVITFSNGSRLKVAVDSIDSHKSWYEVIKASL